MTPHRSAKSIVKPAVQAVVRTLATFPWSRAWLNAYYNSLSVEGRRRYHERYARLFQKGSPLTGGVWTVRFLGKPIHLPLRPDHSWTDWANAVAILGHDPEIKATYERLLSSKRRPEVFLDVGANFGTHSLLLASQGVRTMSFEPNARCREYCAIACDLNHLEVQWEPVAVGNRNGEVELVFPDDETWLGSIADDVVGALRGGPGATSTQTVRLRRLDDYADAVRGKRILMKIDVEGSEIPVLEGASALLAESAPTIIFESNDHAKRPDLHALLARHGYVVSDLPFGAGGEALTAERFASSPATNFLATVSPAAA